jgi:hypothetical protein
MDEEPSKGETLKASGPGAAQIAVGMEVRSIDGQQIGNVKEIREGEFLVDRPLARDLWVPLSSIFAIEDYTSNFRGPVQATAVVLNISSAHVDNQRWRHA